MDHFTDSLGKGSKAGEPAPLKGDGETAGTGSIGPSSDGLLMITSPSATGARSVTGGE